MYWHAYCSNTDIPWHIQSSTPPGYPLELCWNTFTKEHGDARQSSDKIDPGIVARAHLRSNKLGQPLFSMVAMVPENR